MSAPDRIAMLEAENARLRDELANDEQFNLLKQANAEATQAFEHCNTNRRSAILEQLRLKDEIRRLEDIVDTNRRSAILEQLRLKDEIRRLEDIVGTLVEEYNLLVPN
jgi:hypothetical protein